MKPSTRPLIAIGMMIAAFAAGGGSPATEGPATGTTIVPQPTIPTGSASTTTTTSPVTVTHTSVAASTTTTAPVVADPGDLYALDVASGEIDRLTTDPRLDGAPAWLPDGQRLLFGRLVSGMDLTDGNADIFLIAADGAGEQRLIDHPANDLNPRSSRDGTSRVHERTRRQLGDLSARPRHR